MFCVTSMDSWSEEIQYLNVFRLNDNPIVSNLFVQKRKYKMENSLYFLWKIENEIKCEKLFYFIWHI